MNNYQPKGGMCASCTKIGANCSNLNFAAMLVINEFKKDDKLVKVVKCTEWERRMMKTKPEKSCPFCGGSRIYVDYFFNDSNQPKAHVKCMSCINCSVSLFAYGDTPEEALNKAIEKWDTRA